MVRPMTPTVESARLVAEMRRQGTTTVEINPAVYAALPRFADYNFRLHERENVERVFRRHLGIDLRVVDAADLFLGRLAGVSDPEQKRKIIGHTFIDVFEEAARDVGDGVGYLVQGTLYPDVIESFSPRGGPSVTIKTHHNVGGLRPDLPFELIEPLRELFKDEVRQVGRELGLPEEMVGRHPFPGPGLAIRVLGDVTPAALDVLRQADAIYLEEIREAGLYDRIWQAFAVLLPVQAVGVMGDARTYENVVALRAVTSRRPPDQRETGHRCRSRQAHCRPSRKARRPSTAGCKSSIRSRRGVRTWKHGGEAGAQRRKMKSMGLSGG